MNENVAEFSIPPHGISKKQKEKADEVLKKLRFERLQQVGKTQKIYTELISLKYTIIDYLENSIFSEK